MGVVLRLCYHPSRKTVHPLVIEDLLELAYTGKQEAVDHCIEMLQDFVEYGAESRFCKTMRGPFWELKSRSRGGLKGGARVYFFWVGESYREAALCRAEAKSGSEPDIAILNSVAEIIVAYREGKEVW